MMLTDDELLRYSRHLLLDEFGIEGQMKLKESQVTLIGCGGLGHPVALYLAAAGVGSIHLYDADTVEVSNLQRQVGFTTDDLGQAKTQSLKKRILSLNPLINVKTWDKNLGIDVSEDEAQALKSSQLMIDCSDNFETRYLANCLSLQYKTPLVMGAAIEYQGLAALLNMTTQSPCYACIFDEEDQAPAQVRCSEAGVFAPLLGIVGSTLASLSLHALLGHHQPDKLYSWDLKHHRIRQSSIEQNPRCSCQA